MVKHFKYNLSLETAELLGLKKELSILEPVRTGESEKIMSIQDFVNTQLEDYEIEDIHNYMWNTGCSMLKAVKELDLEEEFNLWKE